MRDRLTATCERRGESLRTAVGAAHVVVGRTFTEIECVAIPLEQVVLARILAGGREKQGARRADVLGFVDLPVPATRAGAVQHPDEEVRVWGEVDSFES